MVSLFEKEEVISFLSATVHEITGLWAQEKNDDQRYVLRLGNVDVMEIGLDKESNPELTEYRYFAHVKLLEIITVYLKEPEQLQYWISRQTRSN